MMPHLISFPTSSLSLMIDVEQLSPAHQLDEKEPSVQQVEDLHECGTPILDTRAEQR